MAIRSLTSRSSSDAVTISFLGTPTATIKCISPPQALVVPYTPDGDGGSTGQLPNWKSSSRDRSSTDDIDYQCLVFVQTRNPLLWVMFTFYLSMKIPYIAYRQKKKSHFNEELMNEVIAMNYSCHLNRSSSSLSSKFLPISCSPLSHASLRRRDVQIPINGTVLPIPPLQPRIGLLKVPTIKLR